MTTILITGATQGLGRELALRLSGHTLLLHGRDRDRIDAVAAEVGGDVRTYAAELSDLDQVRALADEVLAAESRLDVLVNNAGVGGGTDPSRRETSAQGHELRFAVNHLAAHLLTRRLLPLLSTSAPTRVVNVASAGQQAIDFDDVMLERSYDGVRAYCRSKLAMIMGTFDLAEELATAQIALNALHPATLMPTQMVRQSGIPPASSLDEGVAATLSLITGGNGVSGRYFDRTAETRAHAQAYDPVARARLADLTRELTESR